MSREAPIQERANESYQGEFGENGDLRALLEAYDRQEEEFEYEGDTLSNDEIIELLQQQPLCIEKLITDHRNEEIQWEILLGTGGPARRVLVTTTLNGIVEKATYQFQDWFEPWTDAENQDQEIVRRYAEVVGYYESDE